MKSRALLILVPLLIAGCETFPEREFADSDDVGADQSEDDRDAEGRDTEERDTADARPDARPDAPEPDVRDASDGPDTVDDVVDAPDAVDDAPDTCERNACGGCDVLLNAPGMPCGLCGTSVCTDDGESVVCDEGNGPNACGGCEVLAVEPGAVCDVCPLKVSQCEGEDAVVCEIPDTPTFGDPLGRDTYYFGTAGRATFTYRFEMGRTEVTQRQWSAQDFPLDANHTRCPDCPVERITFALAAAFANALSERENLPPCYFADTTRPYTLAHAQRLPPTLPLWPRGAECTGYRIPTEAEWEAAARFGLERAGTYGRSLDDVAWWVSTSGQQTHMVGCLRPTQLGLYDVIGNVQEITWDPWGDLPTEPVTDYYNSGRVPGSTTRSSDFYADTRASTLFNRTQTNPTEPSELVGLRLVRTIR